MTSVKTTSHRSRRSWLLAGLVGVTLLLSGCVDGTPLDTPAKVLAHLERVNAERDRGNRRAG